MFTRYAVFYTPPPGGLAAFGAAWLGWDSRKGTKRPHPDVPGVDVAAITRTPRRYGLHATMKAPFSIAPGTDPGDLDAGLADLCQSIAPVRLDDGLELSDRYGFIALRPRAPCRGLAQLESRVVRELDPFRGPSSVETLAKRRRANLSPRQEDYLVRWGYPYVMEEFEFHITLTGRVKGDAAMAVRAALASRIAPLLTRPCVIDALTLMGEDESGCFHEISRHGLQG